MFQTIVADLFVKKRMCQNFQNKYFVLKFDTNKRGLSLKNHAPKKFFNTGEKYRHLSQKNF